ncbi:uncharacterized protein LOC116294322 [Actinia tenebrosa]|uniref:Uncharacterized protein LOC116294322 n=1 Tax=Actinia tenebrosa TaxID=6105 RepID=A0A6P8HYS4_ACTTE|nr:uncharacterized protein LOC116294322 [Actinia tenebrosa]
MDNIAQKMPLLQSTVLNCNSFNDDANAPSKQRELVSYLGNVKILRPLDLGMSGSVVEIYENSKKKRKSNTLPIFEVDFCNDSLCLIPVDEDEGQAIEFCLKRITCCGVDSKKKRIVVFNYHDTTSAQDGLHFQTHALLCDSEKTAKLLAIRIGEIFKDKQTYQTKVTN